MKMPVSVLAKTAAPETSARYSFVSTADIVQRMEKAGFYVAAASAANPRSRDVAFSKHLVDFRLKNAERLYNTEPRVILINSHDGSTAAKVMSGLFRYVCSNGLVVGSAIQQVSQRHAGDAAAEIIHRMQDSARRATEMYARIERWSKIECADKDIEVYGRLATQLRWGNANLFDLDEVLRPRRKEDERGDLWTVFNRVQENTVRGGLSGYASSGRRATSRPITDISRDVDYNAKLWQLTEEFAATLA